MAVPRHQDLLVPPELLSLLQAQTLRDAVLLSEAEVC